MPDRCTPEYERVGAAMGAALPYRRALVLLKEFFPLGDAPAVETTRQRTLQVGARLESAADPPPPKWSALRYHFEPEEDRDGEQEAQA